MKTTFNNTLTLTVLIFSIGCSLDYDISSSPLETGDIYPVGALNEEISDESKYLQVPNFKSMGENVPSNLDLSYMMPAVGNQGSQGSCVGWAVGYALKTFHEKKEELWDLETDSHIFSPSWIYNQINFGVDEGAFVPDALNLLVQKGCDTLNNFKYNSHDHITQPNSASYNRAEKFKALSWRYIPNDIRMLKYILLKKKAIPFRIDVYRDFDTLNKYNPVYDSTEGNSRGGHAATIVGYDDEKRAFKFINSWSKYWGIEGYGWISYDFVTKNNPVNFKAYYVIDNKNEYENIKEINYYNPEETDMRLFYKYSGQTEYRWKDMTQSKDGWFSASIGSDETLFRNSQISIECYIEGQMNSLTNNLTTISDQSWIVGEKIYTNKPDLL